VQSGERLKRGGERCRSPVSLTHDGEPGDGRHPRVCDVLGDARVVALVLLPRLHDDEVTVGRLQKICIALRLNLDAVADPVDLKRKGHWVMYLPILDSHSLSINLPLVLVSPAADDISTGFGFRVRSTENKEEPRTPYSDLKGKERKKSTKAH
jgi:hypothetical protein